MKRSNSCALCEGKLVQEKDLIIKNGKTFTFDIEKCTKCGHSFSTLEESERIRKEINPSLLMRIKRLFSKRFEKLDIINGRVL